ncbi:uncharacterized protein LOC129550051 [Moschus berezovskii]|uniref:uncharacterized protein LOC129550051 n=1 Tax=Moschus berezovskii TaxID=68408 RepID=UPI0024444B15|nr:uncharacterized protein LOC129550051 [Moschus berezovskii]
MSLFSGLDCKTILSLLLRLGQLLSTLVPIVLVSEDALNVGVINWCMFIWCICFVLTLLGFILELGSLFKLPLCNIQFLLRLSDKFRSHLRLSWDGVLHAFGSYFAVVCLAATVIFGSTYIQFFSPGPARNRAITATAFSCLAALLYAIEVAWICLRAGKIFCFKPTFPGVLRRLENYVANIIFTFICNAELYQHQPALVWCVAVYSICFVLGVMNFLMNGCDCDNGKKLPLRFPWLLWVQTVLSVLLYTTAVILWPLYQFHEKLGGQPQRSSDMSCSDQLEVFVCIWDQQLVVAILTGINLLVYMADLVYLVREAFVGGSDGKESACNQGDLSLTESGRYLCEETGNSLQCFAEEIHGKGWLLNVAPPWSQAGLGSPFLNEEASHVKATMVARDSQWSLLLMSLRPCSHPRAAPCDLHGQFFSFIISPSLYLPPPALEWCVAVCSICFIPAALAVLLNLGEWQRRLPWSFPIFQLVLGLLSVLLYVSTLVLWSLYQFSEELGGQPQRSSDMGCISGLTYNLCFWDQRLAVAMLTAVNLLTYVGDMVYWACQVSVGTEVSPVLPIPPAHRRRLYRALSAPDGLFLALLSPCSHSAPLISRSFLFPSLRL